MKRAATGRRDNGWKKRRSVADSGSDVEITPHHLIDTQLESLLGSAAKAPSRSRTKASLKAIRHV